ncbi:MAG: DUF1836 domain-containing protein [Clostridia bacterium]|nr:DUF1836 domain-containing protein [Clostridia bacterium]
MNKNIKEEIKEFHIPRWEELPNIDLYLDQLVTLLEQYLDPYIGVKDGTIITKTMINNYVKQQIIAPPEKKKYNKNHIATLFVICILKQVYSINDIDALVKLAINTKAINESYNSFCNELEKAVRLTFNQEEYTIEENITFEKRLLKSTTLSFAHKLYVEKAFLNN